jgi:hypothetical protein
MQTLNSGVGGENDQLAKKQNIVSLPKCYETNNGNLLSKILIKRQRSRKFGGGN